jgi:hypothetical protein
MEAVPLAGVRKLYSSLRPKRIRRSVLGLIVYLNPEKAKAAKRILPAFYSIYLNFWL